MQFGEIVFYIVIGLIIVTILWRFFKPLFHYLLTPSASSANAKEYEKKLQESLKDEFIIDPETGAKLTLEQAESGHWINHDNKMRESSQSEIDKLPTESERVYSTCINYLKRNKEHTKINFDEEAILTLQNTSILSKYNDWTYSDCFEYKENIGYIFSPVITFTDSSPGYFNTTTSEAQIMFWKKLNTDFGHYYFREKTKAEKIFDIIRKDDDLSLTNYECFTYKKTTNFLLLNQILNKFEGQPDLEIEFNGKNIFIKNRKFINIEDIQRIENIIKSIV